ncbi:MAG TPA: divalent-cation tolerance protein CutA, partial [Rhabdochlamydiaceae bacterium]|nr:divalent-cation tolerance protein CutA [Rhabdochlamydiaceae bacterium]
NLEEARKVARHLIEKKLVACANIIPHIESLYLWNDKIETDQEVKVIFKTKDSHFDRVRDYIEKNGSYEVPEVSKITLDEINPAYKTYLNNSLI